jgi:hypothetical protein
LRGELAEVLDKDYAPGVSSAFEPSRYATAKVKERLGKAVLNTGDIICACLKLLGLLHFADRLFRNSDPARNVEHLDYGTQEDSSHDGKNTNCAYVPSVGSSETCAHASKLPSK